ncbi:MAG: phytoene/squalene synthase family protein, partial [Verrucomicrobiota bacterium]|nr:phytoene/squalene synthase family protein [Verrucomicrobiota bacterium]
TEMAAPNELLGSILKDVSRSFYLTLRVLPRSVRTQIGLAYLLARTTDTIADTNLVPWKERVERLRQFRERIRYTDALPVDFSDLAQGQDNPAEHRLLELSHETLEMLDAMAPEDRGQIQLLLETITRGQELDLRRFGDGNTLTALQTAVELEDYTYHVAGCVGEFWTRLTRKHCFPEAQLDDDEFLAKSARFGRGLQLVNVLRDLPRDLRNGRCYLPADELEAANLQPTDLLNPNVWSKLKPIYNHWMRAAHTHLSAGWRYTNTVPFGQYRLRLACAWPILLGGKTLDKLSVANPMQLEPRIKATRGEVRSILWRSVWRLPFRGAWENLFTPA